MKLRLLFCFMFFGSLMHAQIWIGAQGTYSIQDPLNQPGFGAHLKFVANDVFALGANIRLLPKKVFEETTVFNGANFTNTIGNEWMPLTGSADFAISKAQLRPWIGVESGIFYHKVTRTFGPQNLDPTVFKEAEYRYFAIAPRIGLTYAYEWFGIFAQCQYNYLFGEGKETNLVIPGFTDDFDSKPARRLWFLEFGIYIKLLRQEG